MDMKKCEKMLYKYYCNICDFKCCKQSNLEVHLSTRKHSIRMKRYENDIKDTKKCQKNAAPENVCENCNKIYKFHSGLWRHKKKCFIKEELKEIKEENELTLLSELVLEVVKSNKYLQEQMIELYKNNSVNNVNQINNVNLNNSNNKTFNLNIFLNETCKDAMNITDFVDSIKIQLPDLENVGKDGFVKGISNIFIKNLKILDVNKIPVHCSDAKREVLYVKDENKWEKENDDKEKMTKAVKQIARKNVDLIAEWKNKYPDCVYSDSKNNDQYHNIIMESMGGNIGSEEQNEQKIIHKISKQILIP